MASACAADPLLKALLGGMGVSHIAPAAVVTQLRALYGRGSAPTLEQHKCHLAYININSAKMADSDLNDFPLMCDARRPAAGGDRRISAFYPPLQQQQQQQQQQQEQQQQAPNFLPASQLWVNSVDQALGEDLLAAGVSLLHSVVSWQEQPCIAWSWAGQHVGIIAHELRSTNAAKSVWAFGCTSVTFPRLGLSAHV